MQQPLKQKTKQKKEPFNEKQQFMLTMIGKNSTWWLFSPAIVFLQMAPQG